MKIKFILASIIALFFASSSFAQDVVNDASNKEEHFSEQKKQILNNLYEIKTTIDHAITCTNSAKTREEVKACNDAREAAMQKVRERNLATRKENLQNQMKKLDEKEQKLKNKNQPKN